jgi:serine protease inhibitor
MKPICGLALFVATFAVLACSPVEGPNVRDLTVVEQSLVESANRFGFELFSEVISQSDGGDVFISPLSVSLALGMTANGARNETEAAMHTTLGYSGLTAAEINEGYRGLIDYLVNLDPRVAMEIANSIWYRQGFEVLQEFIEVNRTFFDALVRALDFADPGAADTINAWVADKTHGKIEEIVDCPISDDTVMFLINAIYFKGTWTYQFDPKDTADETFHAPGGDKTVKMMRLHGELSYQQNADFQAVDLPYGHELFSMSVFLPAGGQSVDDLAEALTDENWAAWMEGFAIEEVELSLPRFELEYQQVLNDVLKALGMEVAFSYAADFTGINPAGELFISRVKHKTYVKVNEEGTEAAAVTSVEMGIRAATPITMCVDRPFLFVIHDKHSKAILFMGKIVDPPSE